MDKDQTSQLDLQALFKECAEVQVKDYYYAYVNYYKSDALDFNDVRQEILILVWQLIEKYGPQVCLDDLKKIIRRSVKYRLCVLIKGAVKSFADINHDIVDITRSFIEEARNNTHKNVTLNKLVAENSPDLESMDDKQMLEYIKPKVTDLEYNLVKKLLVENKTFAQTATDLNISKNSVISAFTSFLNKRAMAIKKDNHMSYNIPLEINTERDLQYPDDESGNRSEDSDFCSEVPMFDESTNIDEMLKKIKPILTEFEYKVFVGHVVEQKTLPDLAKELGTTVYRVKYTYFHKALKKVQKNKKLFENTPAF